MTTKKKIVVSSVILLTVILISAIIYCVVNAGDALSTTGGVPYFVYTALLMIPLFLLIVFKGNLIEMEIKHFHCDSIDKPKSYLKRLLYSGAIFILGLLIIYISLFYEGRKIVGLLMESKVKGIPFSLESDPLTWFFIRLPAAIGLFAGICFVYEAFKNLMTDNSNPAYERKPENKKTR